MPTYKVLSKDEIRAGFTYPTLTKIVGKPTYETLDNLQNELIRNASTCTQGNVLPQDKAMQVLPNLRPSTTIVPARYTTGRPK